MQIVTDSGTDLCLPAGEAQALNVHVTPLVVTLDGKTYHEGVDIEHAAFYRLLAASDSLPQTSQPSAGEFAQLYRRLAADDPEILSIHISSGLSGTLHAAQAGAALAPEAHVTHVDTKTLSAPAGWQVEAAARAAKAGWSKEQILALVQQIGAACDALFTLDELKYLIHGGRISHMKGLLASVLNIKPLIGVEKIHGKYVQLGQSRTFERALRGLVDQIAGRHAPGSALRVQILHAENPDAAVRLRELMDQRFNCKWLPLGPLSLVLGAHTGPSMVGIAFASQAAFAGLP